MLNNTSRGNSAAGLAEYGLLIALIAVVCVAALTAVGGSINGVFFRIAGAI